jgi:RNA polymerase sigma factor (sigma-70 family)
MATDLRRRHAALDAGSFEPFYRRHLGEIYRYVLRDVGNRADAEEVTQTAFLDAYRALRRGHEPEQPRAWMYGIARNAARRRHRTQSRRPREVALEVDLADRLVEAEEAQRLDAIRGALEGLRPSHREVVFLREVEGLSYREIARRMGLSLAAVETLLFRARRSLRELLEAEGFRPVVRAGRARSLRGVLVLPAFFTRLNDRVQQLFATDLTAKAAGAATAVALGAGVAVGTQVLPPDAKAGPDASPRAGASVSVPSPWSGIDALLSSPAPTEAAGGGIRDGAGPVRGGGGVGAAGQAQGPTPPGGGASVGSISPPTVELPGVEVPGVELPGVELPEVTTLPELSVPELATPDPSTPAVEVPSVSVDNVAEVPDVPVEVPDVPVEVPDVPVEVPDVPVEVPDVPVGVPDLPGGLPGSG